MLVTSGHSWLCMSFNAFANSLDGIHGKDEHPSAGDEYCTLVKLNITCCRDASHGSRIRCKKCNVTSNVLYEIEAYVAKDFMDVRLQHISSINHQ